METNTDQIIYQGAANMQYQQNAASTLGYNKGGKLTLTNSQLIFNAHSLNVGQKQYIFPLSAIKNTENTFHILTPSPNMIKIELENGEIYQFVVSKKDKDKWISLILEYAQNAKNTVSTSNSITVNMTNETQEAQTFTETTKNSDIDKNASNSIKTNKHRNVKIIAVVLIAVIIIANLSVGDSKFRENYAKEVAESEVIELLDDSDTFDISNIEIYDTIEGTSQDLYVVTLIVQSENNLGISDKVNCVLFIMLSENVTKNNYKKENITSSDVTIYGKFYYTDDEKTEAIEKLDDAISELQSSMN